ncbi:MAG: exostosin domain-containing protein [Acidimicrobiales bacterium]
MPAVAHLLPAVMKIYLARAEGVTGGYSFVPELSRRLREQRSPYLHREVDDPIAADVVLFADCHLLGSDWRLRRFMGTDLAKRYLGKLAVYDERDMPWCRLPGIYVSMPSRGFVPRWQVPGAYWTSGPLQGRSPCGSPVDQADLLFSFVGTRTHPCRDAILDLGSRRAHLEPVEGFMFWDTSSPNFEERRRNFAEVIYRSKFVLCPRGHGTSSIRLYEVLSAGRVPVVIADDWVAPAGPDWQQFSIRWPEARVAELPAVLGRMEGAAEEMGARARSAYESWFAPHVVVSRQLDQLERLVMPPGRGRFPRGGAKNVQYLECAGRAAVGALRRAREHRHAETDEAK